MEWYEPDEIPDLEEPQLDAFEGEAVEELTRLFDENQESVFFSRQLEVRHEDQWFHWVTNRALRNLIEAEVIRTETRTIANGGTIHLMWYRGNRYYRREAARVVKLVEEYANPYVGAAIGVHGEAMVLDGFARRQFLLLGRNIRTFEGGIWNRTAHDLDFIFTKDDLSYGVEVKNTLGYMEHQEMENQDRALSRTRAPSCLRGKNAPQDVGKRDHRSRWFCPDLQVPALSVGPRRSREKGQGAT